MATEIVMPRLSDTMDSGTIARWLKHEGDAVSKGEILAEIETDKANMELESFSAGVLAQILVSEGQSANLGQPIAVLAASEEEAQSLRSGATKAEQSQEAGATGPGVESGGEQQSADGRTERQADAEGRTEGEPINVPSAEAPPSPPPSDGATEQASPSERIKASPLARRMAEEHGLNLSQVRGTGPGGRITKEDVQAFMRQAPSTPAPPPTPERAPEPAPATQRDTGRAPQPVQMTRMQQTIARRMTESRFSAPEFVLVFEVDMTAARTLLRDIAGVEGAPRVGPNDLLIKAVASALTQHPEVNAGWENDTIVRYGRVNVGFAVALPDGLVVPVVQDADKKSLGQIAVEAKELIAKAQGGKLAPRDYEHGTFSISNLGMYGIDQFTPVINPPEACILGVGAITPKPVVIDGEVAVRDRMRLTLSCDHRVVYGAQGAEFLRTLRRMLETPYLIIL